MRNKVEVVTVDFLPVDVKTKPVVHVDGPRVCFTFRPRDDGGKAQDAEPKPRHFGPALSEYA